MTVFGSISDSDVPRDIKSLLRNKAKKGRAQLGQMPQRMSVPLSRHTKAVNAVHWSPTHAHLLASASMDQTICIWNVWSSDQKVARVLNFHNAAIKDVKWSGQGLFVLSCGYDSSSKLVDVERGIETQVYKEDQVVSVVKFHPDNFNLFVSGGPKAVVHEYIRGHDPILDVEFTMNGKQIISSSDVSGRNLSENSIVVWDVSRQVPLSNQVHVPFPFTFERNWFQQWGANIATSERNLNKYKRYESHGVSGFPIKCMFSVDGEKLISGSSDGSIYFYDYRSSELVRKIKAYEQACIDIAIHPSIPNGWDSMKFASVITGPHREEKLKYPIVTKRGCDFMKFDLSSLALNIKKTYIHHSDDACVRRILNQINDGVEGGSLLLGMEQSGNGAVDSNV
ncbi:Transducin/WD40 repeat-like superfamily protein [Prunus dulcis]|uniref:Transducin/WD40 repeat-like superfamily protein n=1 Tax=Prunus dulcis TaxID=3755 RepID=A0A5H2XQQ1_PRUDU|nr:Transducin/WD40 repeat-like superfamily protein [Prunus dulcis]